MRKNIIWTAPIFTVLMVALIVFASAQELERDYLPIVQRPLPTPTMTPTPSPTMTPIPTITPTPTVSPTPSATPESIVEFRGLWVSRFDWAAYNNADPAKVEEIVENAAAAGFNVLFFQVRGTADAYYTPGLEPWAQRLTGTLGQDPGWDPLQLMIDKAHAKGIQVHAYINTYPVWTGCEAPPDDSSPRHLYYQLLDEHGATDGKVNGMQWDTDGNVVCHVYQYMTPASVFGDDHLLAVAQDLVTRYDVDGLHLDHIRYVGKNASCDPVSAVRYGDVCFGDDEYDDWQRQQVNGTVAKLYAQVVPLKPGLWLSAAVWPVHKDKWGWNANQGYVNYYQDSKAWLQSGHIDSISPMIYTSSPGCPDESFWTQSRWQTLVADYQAESNGRFIIPGIGATYCTFDEIAWRIAKAREFGTAGHAIFSYSGLADRGYFDDLAAGPYAIPATVPEITWHP